MSSLFTVRVANGHEMMPSVIGTGCMLTPVVAAFLAVGEAPLAATVAALVVMGIAGEIAAEGAAGPGTMKPRLIDALYSLDGETIAQRARLG